MKKIIHRYWDSGSIPSQIDFSKLWAKFLPEWELRTWTDDNLPEMVNRKQFDAAPHAGYKSNILRYEVLLRYGGIYVDCDVKPLRSIQDTIEGLECFVTQHLGPMLCGAVQGASEPDHRLYRRLVSSVPARMANPSISRMSPVAVGVGLLGNLVGILNQESQGSVAIIPREKFCPLSYEERRQADSFDEEANPDALLLHLWEHKWDIQAKPEERGN